MQYERDLQMVLKAICQSLKGYPGDCRFSEDELPGDVRLSASPQTVGKRTIPWDSGPYKQPKRASITISPAVR